MNLRQWFTQMFAAAAPKPEPSQYQYVALHNIVAIDDNRSALGHDSPDRRHPWVERRLAPVQGVIPVPDLDFVAALFQNEAAEAESLYEARKAGIRPRRPETNNDSLR